MTSRDERDYIRLTDEKEAAAASEAKPWASWPVAQIVIGIVFVLAAGIFAAAEALFPSYATQAVSIGSAFTVGYLADIATALIGVSYIVSGALADELYREIHARARPIRWIGHAFGHAGYLALVVILLYRQVNAGRVFIIVGYALFAPLLSYIQSSNESMNAQPSTGSKADDANTKYHWFNEQWGIEGFVVLVAIVIGLWFLLGFLGGVGDTAMPTAYPTTNGNLWIPVVYGIIYSLALLVLGGGSTIADWLGQNGREVAFIVVDVLYIINFHVLPAIPSFLPAVAPLQ